DGPGGPSYGGVTIGGASLLLLVAEVARLSTSLAPSAELWRVPLLAVRRLSMDDISRRAFTQGTLGSLLAYSLFDTLFSREAFADEVAPIAAKWIAELDQVSRDLKGKPLEQ